MHSIKVILKDTYGTPRFYPACEYSKALTKLTGTKTLTTEHTKVIQSMGVKVRVVHSDYGHDVLTRKIERGNE